MGPYLLEDSRRLVGVGDHNRRRRRKGARKMTRSRMSGRRDIERLGAWMVSAQVLWCLGEHIPIRMWMPRFPIFRAPGYEQNCVSSYRLFFTDLSIYFLVFFFIVLDYNSYLWDWKRGDFCSSLGEVFELQIFYNLILFGVGGEVKGL